MTQEAGIPGREDDRPLRAAPSPRATMALLVFATLAAGFGAGYLVGAWERGATAMSHGHSHPVVTLLAVLAAGAVAATAGAVSAARERHRARIDAQDAALARTSWRLDFALAASGIGSWDVDLATDELFWDERSRALFGVDARRGFFSEADWIAVLHPEDRDRAVAEAHAAVDGGGRFVSDYRIVLPDGEVRHIRDNAAVYHGADGSHRLIGLVWDVTPDVMREHELEVRRVQAEAATLAKSRFLATMSHEIRTPMTGVLGMLDLMLADPDSDRQGERAAIARASARGLLALLNDILDFSKLEAQRTELDLQAVDPRAMVSEVIDLMAPVAERKSLRLGWSASPEVPRRIVTDPLRFRQILTNLVSNATKFTEAGGVEVRVGYAPGPDGGALEVAVEDTGVGIPERAYARLFEEFVQGDDPISRTRGGTGLGLSISRRLCALLGGRIDVRSAVGVGSVFEFSIPAPPAEDARAAPEPAGAHGVEPAAAPRLRVLVAEDNATNQYLLRAYLEAQGHAVTTVHDGAQAVRAAAAGGFDVVLMDVEMPELDGRSAARAIRELPAPACGVAIVAITATAPSDDGASYRCAGMDDVVSKPVDFRALDRALREAVDRRRG